MPQTRWADWRTRTEERVRAGLADSAERHPRLVSTLQTIVRHRLWIIGAAALAMAVVDGRGSFEVQDPNLFIDAGKKLFGSDALDIYANETVQEGPLGLLFWGVIGHISDLINVDARMVAAVVIYLSFTCALVFLIRSALRERGRPSEDLEFFAAAIVLFGGLVWTMLSTGHIAEGVIPLLWFQAARDVRRGHLERAGLLIALSAGLKLWGILGVPILLLAPELDWRKLLRAGVIAGAVATVFYAPFALLGEFNSLDYEWHIANSSLIHQLFPDNETFTWQMRAVQSAVAVAVGAACAMWGRGRDDGVWAVPVVLLATKLLLDPIVFVYYPLSLGVLALLTAIVVLARTPAWFRLVLAVVVYLILYPTWLTSGNSIGVVALLIGLAAGFVIPRKSERLEPS